MNKTVCALCVFVLLLVTLSVQAAPSQDTLKKFETPIMGINDLIEKERVKLLTNNEIAQLTRHMKTLLDFPDKDFPSELLGHVEGIAITVREMLKMHQSGRDIEVAVKTAEMLRAKVVAIPSEIQRSQVVAGNSKILDQVKTAVLGINYITEHSIGRDMTSSEIKKVGQYISILLKISDKDFPRELLGHVEGISIVVREKLTDKPDGAQTRALAEKLRAKVSAIE